MPLPLDDQYTYQDILNMEGAERYELIDGKLFLMAPPSRVHQEILTELVRQFANFLEGRRCKVYPSPFSVRLFAKRDADDKLVKTAVEPDISVVCDPSKLDKHGCAGAPDLIIEILSPSTAKYDRMEKLRLYQSAGVKEYWIVNPIDHSVQILSLDDSGQYRILGTYDKADIVPVQVLQSCFIDLSKVF